MSTSVAFVSTARAYGGGESALTQLLQHLSTEHRPMLLISPPNSTLEEQALSSGAELVIDPRLKPRTNARGLLNYLFITIRLNVWLLNILSNNRVEALVLNGPAALPWTFLTRILLRTRIAVWNHTVIESAAYCFFLKWFFWGHRMTCVSEAAATPVRSLLNRNRIQVIHNGVEIPPPERTAQRRTVNPSIQDPLRVLCAGRITFRKGIHILIEALGMISPEIRSRIQVTIAGKAWTPADETYERELRKRAESLGVADLLQWTGFIDLKQSLHHYEVLAFPSLYFEACPMIVLEAMAAGLVVVASKRGGTIELLDPSQTGILLQPDLANALSETLETYLKSGLPNIGMHAAAEVRKRFSSSEQIQRISRFFELTGSHPNS